MPTLKELQLGPYAKPQDPDPKKQAGTSKKVVETQEEAEEEETERENQEQAEEPPKPYTRYKPTPNPHEVYRQEQLRLQQLREEAKK